MNYTDQPFVLRDGRQAVLRSPTADDGPAVLALLQQAWGETDFLARTPAEVDITASEESAFLAGLLKSPREAMVAAFIGDRPVGIANLGAAGSVDRQRHLAGLGLTVLKEAWRLGLGTALTSAVIDLAAQAGYERLELEVVSANYRAIALYGRLGFQVYGLRQHTFRYTDGTYADGLLMARDIVPS